MAEAERECLRYQQLFESEQKFIQIAADKDTIMELFRQLMALPIDQKRRLLHGLVYGDIIVKPPTPDAVLEIDEGPNALNKWIKITWKYNPAIIQGILGVKIVSEVETTGDGSDECGSGRTPDLSKAYYMTCDHVGGFRNEIHTFGRSLHTC